MHFPIPPRLQKAERLEGSPPKNAVIWNKAVRNLGFEQVMGFSLQPNFLHGCR